MNIAGVSDEAFAQEIVKGDHDDNLDTIANAVRVRRDILGRAALVTVVAGQRVRLKDRDDLRPTYLRGLTGVVKRKGSVNVSVDLDDKEAARRYAGGIRIPADFLEVVNDSSPYERAMEREHDR